MISDELKVIIRDSRRKDCFDYREASVTDILNYADSWRQEWTIIYKRILERIKKGQGYEDEANENGKYMPLPVNSEKNMVIFFEPKSDGRYDVYQLSSPLSTNQQPRPEGQGVLFW
jgi:hypothetical protein